MFGTTRTKLRAPSLSICCKCVAISLNCLYSISCRAKSSPTSSWSSSIKIAGGRGSSTSDLIKINLAAMIKKSVSSSGSAKSYITTSKPKLSRKRAITKPSPPLLPFPVNIRTDSNCRSIHFCIMIYNLFLSKNVFNCCRKNCFIFTSNFLNQYLYEN